MISLACLILLVFLWRAIARDASSSTGVQSIDPEALRERS